MNEIEIECDYDEDYQEVEPPKSESEEWKEADDLRRSRELQVETFQNMTNNYGEC